jgi:hypothetical protein
MQAYQPFSSRRWYAAEVRAVRRLGKEAVGYDFDILNDIEQAGRTVSRKLPAILTPNSLLYTFLRDGFGVRLKENDSLDLSALVGRAVELRFTKAVNGQEQTITAIRPSKGDTEDPQPAPSITGTPEDGHGLG